MPDHPKTYKAALQREKGKPFEIIDVDYKDPKQGQVVVKVLACGGELGIPFSSTVNEPRLIIACQLAVCRSDEILRDEVMPVLPRIPGHEVCLSFALSRETRYKTHC